MTCPNCGVQTDSAFCPHCGTRQPSAAAPVITLPAPGKYLGNSDYLVVNKTCITVYKSGLFGYKSRQLSFRDIGELFGKSDNWACVIYHRARKSIKEKMEES